MIVIEQDNFKMIQSNETGPFFDLYLPHTTNEGKENERTEMKLNGYGYSFEYCIDLLIKIRLNNKKESYSINEYMQAYVNEIKEIKKLIQHIEIVKEKKEKLKIEEE